MENDQNRLWEYADSRAVLESFSFRVNGSSRVFGYLVSSFIKDHITRKIGTDKSGWRSLVEIGHNTRIPISVIYGTRGGPGAPVEELVKRGLAEARVFVAVATWRLGYISAFVVAAIANASVTLLMPYYPLIVRLSQALNVWGVILAAAAGSTIGESVTFFVGRTSHSAVQETRINNWIERQLRLSWRAGPLLFALAAVPNPAFDIAGLLAGAFGVPFWLFLVLVFLGRIIRMSLVAFAGPALESI